MTKAKNRDTRVLVVDDEPMMSDSLRQHLAEEGYAVDTAANGAEAIDLFDGGAHHLVICDLQLPDMDGLTLLRHMKDAKPSTEVIVITAYGSVETAVEATKAGAFYFVEKPFDFEELQPLVEKALERRQLITETESMRRQLSTRADSEGPPLRDIDLSVGPGEIVGIAGVEGNGQRTLVRALAALAVVERGRIEIDGQDVSTAALAERRKSGLRIIPFERNSEGLSLTSSLWENWLVRELLGQSALTFIRPDQIRAACDQSRQTRDVHYARNGQQAGALSGGIPNHSNVLETKTQAVTGHRLYGKSLIAYMKDMELLGPHTTIAHGVWVDDDDIDMLGEARCFVVHNSIANRKLGSGVAPVRRLMPAGVNVAPGSDGASSNDTVRLFDVMRVAALVHSVTGCHHDDWLAAIEVLSMATRNGAASAGLQQVTGSLETGKSADLPVLDLNALAFTPRNKLPHHLVYAENGSAIETVMIAGETVYAQGRLCKISEEDILAEIREQTPAILADHAIIEKTNRVFRRNSPALRVNRYSLYAQS